MTTMAALSLLCRPFVLEIYCVQRCLSFFPQPVFFTCLDAYRSTTIDLPVAIRSSDVQNSKFPHICIEDPTVQMRNSIAPHPDKGSYKFSLVTAVLTNEKRSLYRSRGAPPLPCRPFLLSLTRRSFHSIQLRSCRRTTSLFFPLSNPTWLTASFSLLNLSPKVIRTRCVTK